MKKLLTIFLLLVSIPLYSQYTIQPAFPNLGNFFSPTELITAKDGSNKFYISEITGKVFVFQNIPSVSTKKTFLDVGSLLTGNDGALLGLAFHPNYKNNHYFYIHYIFDSASVFYLRIARFTTSNNPDSASLSSCLNILTFTEPQSYHPGGRLEFGNDKYLYASFGDGGLNGILSQDKTLLAGKIIRINVDAGNPYSIPVTNPYYNNNQGYRQEIYATGFRNPWKFSQDKVTNKIWCGDVGEILWEEIDIIESGKNYGWNQMEGNHCYAQCDTAGRGFTRPVYEYFHTGGSASITGGYVYRGHLRPELYGKYIYGDFIYGTLHALSYNFINPPTDQLLNTSFLSPDTFGEDENGELYFADYTSGIYKFYEINIMAFNLKVILEGFYNNNRLNLQDTADVYLRNTVFPYSVIDSAKIKIDTLTFTGLGFFNHAANSNYYIVIKHRNGLETWSNNPQTFTRGGSMSYDFTVSNSAYGNNLKLVNTKYCVFSGDVNKDGSIDVSDIIQIYNKSVTRYDLIEDLNGDSIIDITDVALCYNNSSAFVEIRRP